MKFSIKRMRGLLAFVLAVVLLCALCSAALAAPISGTLYTPTLLKTAPTKEMVYFKTGSGTYPSVSWTQTYTPVGFLPAAAEGSDLTCSLKVGSTWWIGTKNGLMSVNFQETDVRDIVQYYTGPRYLFGGDDWVTGLADAADGSGGIYVKNALGATYIQFVAKNMEERGYVYEDIIRDVYDRNGMTGSSINAAFTGGAWTGSPSTNDNDGLWTAMYAMGEIFRYRTLKDTYGASPTAAQRAEISAARAAAVRATKAVMLLEVVSGRDNGFPCRSYMMTTESGAQLTNGFQNTNGFWFGTRYLGSGEAYPEPIIDEMTRTDGVLPIGIATVRVTRDAMSKRGDMLFANSTEYNGLSLSHSAIETFKTKYPGLGTTIVGRDNQVFAVMTDKHSASNNPTTYTSVSDTINFQLTVPVYARIDPFYNDLFPVSMIGSDGYVDQTKIVYKADTSSDEVDGHFALLYTAYEYLCGNDTDPELVALKEHIVKNTVKMTNLILEDDRYFIMDAQGKATQWSRWLSQYFNDSIADFDPDMLAAPHYLGINEDGDDILAYGFEDGPLNALEVMAAIKGAIHIASNSNTGGRFDTDLAVYRAAYEEFYRPQYSTSAPYNNGQGYIDMAMDYHWRFLVRQATNAYDMEQDDDTDNWEYWANKNATTHEDWTQYVNYSDEELGWFPVYMLALLETDVARRGMIAEAYELWYENEKREENPFYDFLNQLVHNKSQMDLTNAARYFYRSPQYNINFAIRLDRQDVFYVEPGNRDGNKTQVNYALPIDEKRVHKANSNPFNAQTINSLAGYSPNANYNYNAAQFDGNSVFTLPYWLGRYFDMIRETPAVCYGKRTAAVARDATSVTLTDPVSLLPLTNVWVQFYGTIGGQTVCDRVRTNAAGVATTALSSFTRVIINERVIGNNLYLYQVV